MALKKCEECGHEVSTKADKCPNCGANTKSFLSRPIGCGTLAVLGLFVFIALIAHWTSNEDSNNNKQNSTAQNTPKPKRPTRETKQSSKKAGSEIRNHITKQGYLACVSERSLDEAVSYAAQKDNAALAQIIGSGECIVLKQGTQVTIEDVKMFSGKVAIRPVGTRLKLWTVNEAIK